MESIMKNLVFAAAAAATVFAASPVVASHAWKTRRLWQGAR
jgi:hypothetical protein